MGSARQASTSLWRWPIQADTDTDNTKAQRTQTPHLKGDLGEGGSWVEGTATPKALLARKQLAGLSKMATVCGVEKNPTTKEKSSFGSGDLPTDRLRPLAGIQRTFTSGS